MFSSSNRPEAIASHTGCGAAGLAYKKIQEMIAQGEDQAVADIFNFLEIKNLPETSDKLGEIFTEKLAKEVNAKYYHMFSGESSDHAESGIIISSINFDERYIKAPGQQFFNSSTAIFEAKDGYLKAEISALTNIAFHHGKMSPKSSAYNPNDKFYYLIIADQANAPRLQALAHDLVSNSEFKNRLQIEVFVKE
jgi:hypothetical protein